MQDVLLTLSAVVGGELSERDLDRLLLSRSGLEDAMGDYDLSMPAGLPADSWAPMPPIRARPERLRDALDQVSIDTASLPFGKQDHDVLMLSDDSLDGVEDSGSGVNQAWGMVNLAREGVFHLGEITG
ncbi:hypothetical protein [Streptomyces sp. NPDC090798]|uniref:hypothetical protein n=1 Tax=Streptomyces sp. NPDC090798 TaxID=3365968 RepID=UPI00382E59EA